MREAEDLMGASIGSQEILGSATCVSFFWTTASREPELAEPEYGGVCHLWGALIGIPRAAVPRMVAAAVSGRHTWRKAE